jgi:REP element-mobilizing transposase RayT
LPAVFARLTGGAGMKESVYFKHFKVWQEGYSAFTYSIKEKNVITDYIKRSITKKKRFMMNIKGF